MQHHQYSLSEIDGLIPWERDVYINMLVDHLKEERLKMENAQRGAM